jgi:hypothetical protein
MSDLSFLFRNGALPYFWSIVLRGSWREIAAIASPLFDLTKCRATNRECKAFFGQKDAEMRDVSSQLDRRGMHILDTENGCLCLGCGVNLLVRARQAPEPNTSFVLDLDLSMESAQRCIDCTRVQHTDSCGIVKISFPSLLLHPRRRLWLRPPVRAHLVVSSAPFPAFNVRNAFACIWKDRTIQAACTFE